MAGSERTDFAVAVDLDRFAAGWRLLLGRPDVIDLGDLIGPRRRVPDIVVDVMRSEDLAAFTVEGYDLELVVGDAPILRPTPDNDGLLLVRFPFQNLAEDAIYETPEGGRPPQVPHPDDPTLPPIDDPDFDPSDARPVPPIDARPAKNSRLVFRVPQGDEIEFSTQGILDAMGDLEMVVHSLAMPRPPALPGPIEGPIFELPGGFTGVLATDGLIVRAGTEDIVRGEATPAEALSAHARDARRARAILSTRAGLVIGADLKVDASDVRSFTIGGVEVTVPGSMVGSDLILPDLGVKVRPRKRLSKPAAQLETAIEAPFRLIISPSDQGGWAHSNLPVAAGDAPHRVELWHSRLGVRVDSGDEVAVDERANRQRIVRAIWTRDRERFPDWQDPANQPDHDHDPFRTSLDGADRHMLVRQTAETWIGVGNRTISPVPADATGLFLSSLGAWVDLHGTWTTAPYSEAGLESILLWDHVAPMGRDQFVRVMYPGYLYPFGHKATLVKVTERKMKDASPSIASLYQRMFIVVGEALKTFSQRDLPFDEVRLSPLVTPTIDDPGTANLNKFFFPSVGGIDFPFNLHTVDREGTPISLVAPLMWVAESFGSNATNRTAVDSAYASSPNSTISAGGQKIAYAPVKKGGDTVSTTTTLKMAGAASTTSATPKLATASVVLPAVEQLSPVGDVVIQYAQTYLGNGFGGTANSGDVWAELTGVIPNLAFGGNGAGSDKAGGFLQPNMAIKGLSRISGTVGDVAGAATQTFDPAQFLASGVDLPKLFGVVELLDLIELVVGDLDRAPSIVSEALDRIEGFVADLERAKKMVEDAVAEAQKLVDRAANKAAELQTQAQQALTAAQNLQGTIEAAVDDILDQIAALPGATEAAVQAALANPLQALKTATTEMEQVAPLLPPLIRQQLLNLAKILRTIADAVDIVTDIYRFLNGFGTSAVMASFRFEWKPPMKSWPNANDPILALQEDSLVLAVEGRVSGKGEMGIEVLAELRDFVLHLLPAAPLVRFKFDHLAFRAGSSGKPEVDVVLQDIEFVGILSFIEVLKELIPFDGFSDPPFLEIDASGLTAGFTLDLPNVAIGVFNLSNMSLGADIQVPFLGKSVTVGFNFCTRERPMTLTVMAIGGGGWFMIRLAPDGLDVLELGLEAGAALAVDFGVASGSISAMIGIYMRLEGDTGSLTGYFRLRGEVDVLGLISASIELYLELVYEFDSGKMIGSARLTVKVEVLFFSASVTIECERRFAGSNGDPSFLDIMGLEPDGSSPAWSEYCLAFAGA